MNKTLHQLGFNAAMLLIFFFIGSIPASCSTWQVFNVASGFPSSCVTSFSAFSKWLAVGTNQGLAIYDGDDSRWFIPDLPSEIASFPVKDLAFDEDGGLWVAGSNGLIHISNGIANEYSTTDGLPNVDVDRLQILPGSIIAGCFGGYIARAVLPGGGKTTFQPVNFEANDSLKISSIGISAMALNDSCNGFFATLGHGLGQINGNSSCFPKSTEGASGDWVNDIWEFVAKNKEIRLIAVSPEGLTFTRNGFVTDSFAPITEKPWFTSVITIKNPDYVNEAFEEIESKDEQTTFLKEFLEGRNLYLGTKAHGIWSFQKGKWKNFNTSNSSLPSDKINRLYVMQRFIVAATDGGLVLIPIDSFQNDEFKYSAIGTPYAKTIFSPPPIVKPETQYFQVLRNKDYWFVHESGLSRFKTRGSNITSKKENHNDDGQSGTRQKFLSVNSRREDSYFAQGSTRSKFSGLDADEKAVPDSEFQHNFRWQLYSKQTFNQTDVDVFSIYSEKISKVVADKANQCLWLIFDQKYLCRMWLQKEFGKKEKRNKDTPTWEFIIEDAPWQGEIKLTTLWIDNGKLYIGTDGAGFYLLNNPESTNRKANPFQWQHFGTLENLQFTTVLGFSKWKDNGVDSVAILHPRSVSSWDGKSFRMMEMGGLEKYTCIAGDQTGNLWVGSEAGLFRMTPEGDRKEYNSFKTGFESNNITALAVPAADSSRICGIWVACDEKTKMAADGRLWDGLDERPLTIRIPGETENNGSFPANRIKLIEQDIHGGSLHFFNGTVWEKWSYGGINDIMIENDYIWLSSNLRIRRIRLAR